MSTFFRTCALTVLAGVAGGCTTPRPPASSAEDLQRQRDRIRGPAGYLGITAQLNLDAVAGTPFVEFVFQDTTTGAKQNFRADLRAAAPRQNAFPLIFPVAQGEYVLLASRVWIPGGKVYGQSVKASEASLGLERYLAPFTVRDNMFLHLARISIQLQQRQMESSLWYNVEAKYLSIRPPASVWQPFLPFLNRTLSYYLRKTRLGTFATPPIRWDAPSEETSGEIASAEGAKTFAPEDVKRVTQAHAVRIRACHLRNSPNARGNITVEYIIAPTGRVFEANVVARTMQAPGTEECILNLYRKMRFPPTPSDDYETWTSEWTF